MSSRLSSFLRVGSSAGSSKSNLEKDSRRSSSVSDDSNLVTEKLGWLKRKLSDYNKLEYGSNLRRRAPLNIYPAFASAIDVVDGIEQLHNKVADCVDPASHDTLEQFIKVS